MKKWKPNMKKWKPIKDTDIQNIWHCEECQNEVQISPKFYQNNGTPSCCDRDMFYVETQIAEDYPLRKK